MMLKQVVVWLMSPYVSVTVSFQMFLTISPSLLLATHVSGASIPPEA